MKTIHFSVNRVSREGTVLLASIWAHSLRDAKRKAAGMFRKTPGTRLIVRREVEGGA